MGQIWTDWNLRKLSERQDSLQDFMRGKRERRNLHSNSDQNRRDLQKYLQNKVLRFFSVDQLKLNYLDWSVLVGFEGRVLESLPWPKREGGDAFEGVHHQDGFFILRWNWSPDATLLLSNEPSQRESHRERRIPYFLPCLLAWEIHDSDQVKMLLFFGFRTTRVPNGNCTLMMYYDG